MTAPAPKFRSVAATPLDVSDDEIMQFSDDLGIPALVKPEPKVSEAPAPKIDAGAQISPVEKLSPSGGISAPPALKSRPHAENIAPAPDILEEDSERVSIEMPVYVADQLRRRSFEERSSKRYYILKALKAFGFEIHDSDIMTDGRRKIERRLK
jgi:hypothetical protein